MSRPRSTRSNPAPAAAPARGARAGRPGRVFVAAPKSDIYVALLGVSLGAMILATLLLVILFGRYDFKVSI